MSRCLCCDDRDAGYHYACDRCVNTMRVWLRELEDYAAIIVAMRSTPSAHPTGSIGVAWGSKPPVSLTRLAVMDPRSAAPDDPDEPAAPPHSDIVSAVLRRDGRRCTWISGLPVGGPYAYLEADYVPDRRCSAVAIRVDYIANPDEHDMDNLRALCSPHLAHARARRPAADGPDPTGRETHDHVRSLPGSIHGIACWIREEREKPEPRTWTLVSELRFLRGEVSACALEQWVNELHADLKDLHHQARSLANDAPKPLARCLTVGCDGMVFWDTHDRVDQASCAACKREYSGLDLVRLGVTQEAG